MKEIEMFQKKRDEEVRKKEEEKNGNFDSVKAEVACAIETFKRLNTGMRDSLLNVADADKRLGLKKMEDDFESLKSKMILLSGIDPVKDIDDVRDKFVADAETVFLATQKLLLEGLKESNTSGGKDQSSRSST